MIALGTVAVPVTLGEASCSPEAVLLPELAVPLKEVPLLLPLTEVLLLLPLKEVPLVLVPLN